MNKSSGVSRRTFNSISAALGVRAADSIPAQVLTDASLIPGVWRLRFGTPETLTPITTRRYQPAHEALSQLAGAEHPPLPLSSVTGSSSSRGFAVCLPLEAGEMIYGLGLQFHSFLQRGLKKKLRVNADPSVDLGDSHAPVPFYVSTHGYAVLIDSARYLNIYCGNEVKKGTPGASVSAGLSGVAVVSGLPASYNRFHLDQPSQVLVEVPEARGVDVYLFAGPSMREAIQRYNCFPEVAHCRRAGALASGTAVMANSTRTKSSRSRRN